MTFFPDWPRSAAATFAAAALAGVVALISTIVTLVDGAVSRRRVSESIRREQWWDRWSFTVDRALSDDPGRRSIGATLLHVLVETPDAGEDDRRVAAAVAEALHETPGEDGTEGDDR